MGTTTTTFDRETTRATVKCFHCGTGCRSGAFSSGDKSFCCQGCRMVFELLAENGLNEFYALSSDAGVRVKATRADQFKYLDATTVRERLVDFQDDRMTRVTFHIPAIHCIACVWLLENLFRLNTGIGESKVNFPRKEVAITFTNTCRNWYGSHWPTIELPAKRLSTVVFFSRILSLTRSMLRSSESCRSTEERSSSF